MITTCCEWLKTKVRTAGEQGIAVVASRDDESRRFYIQARPLSPWQAQVWERLTGSEPGQTHMDPLFRDERGRLVAVAVAMRVPILFCPHCGAHLGRLIERQREDFDKLAESHRPFADK